MEKLDTAFHTGKGWDGSKTALCRGLQAFNRWRGTYSGTMESLIQPLLKG